jgi:hypothetical protein
LFSVMNILREGSFSCKNLRLLKGHQSGTLNCFQLP